MSIDKAELEKVHLLSYMYAKGFLALGEMVQPCVMAFRYQKESPRDIVAVVIPIPGEFSPRDRELAAQLAQHLVDTLEDVIATVIVSEAWVASVQAKDAEEALRKRNEFGSVEDAPGSREVVIHWVYTKTDQHLFTDDIVRTDEAVDLLMGELQQAADFGGRFARTNGKTH